MSRRHLASDLPTLDEDEVQFLRASRSDFIGPVHIGIYIVFVGQVFDVVGDGKRVQTFTPNLLGANTGPYEPVGEDGVHMEIALERQIARDIRDVDLRPHVLLRRAFECVYTTE